MNKVILLGNLTSDIDIRYTPSGTAVAKVNIATNRKFKGTNGEQKDEVMYISLTLFGRTAEIANQYLRKGSKVLVEGRLVFEQWVAQDGTKKSRHSVTVESLQMLDSKSNNAPQNTQSQSNSYNPAPQQPQQAAAPQRQPQQQQQQQQAPQQPHIPEIDIDDDEIPF
jgi:single-strand DNA-binding protein